MCSSLGACAERMHRHACPSLALRFAGSATVAQCYIRPIPPWDDGPIVSTLCAASSGVMAAVLVGFGNIVGGGREAAN